jgi:hypothetical protein
MAIVRDNPLPIGRYWIDVPAAKRSQFHSWLTKWKGSVVVETTESGDEIDFYIFRTLSPYVEWEGPGLPSTADSEVKDSSDVVDRPDPEELELLPDMAKGIGIGAGIAIGAGLIGLALFLSSRK